MKWLSCIIVPILLSLMLPGCLEQKDDNDYFHRAEYYFSTGQFNQAGTLYQQYIDEVEKGRKRYQAWNRLLSIRMDIYNDVQGGLDILKAMQMEYNGYLDKILDINARISATYEKLGQPLESRRFWKKNMELAESRKDKKKAALYMSKTGIQLREFEMVREDLEKFSDCSGETDVDLCSMINYTRGKSYYLENDLTKAGEILSKAYSLNAGNEYICRVGMLLVQVLLEQDKMDQAKAVLEEIQDIHPNPGAIGVRLQNLNSDQD
ncbi:tetratricopeptide repeat protein [Desulfonatronospira sp.]|uniref:tetratricopeptide repeat protein n=1 Tax=Desulfonatronospira sp. TaxID=1962951 RepID=UPI0025B9528C|nr:tetratricopeptide repeat protein [Desulfonatronospira sp.]